MFNLNYGKQNVCMNIRKNHKLHNKFTRLYIHFHTAKVSHTFVTKNLRFCLEKRHITACVPLINNLYAHGLYGFAKYVKHYNINNHCDQCTTAD